MGHKSGLKNVGAAGKRVPAPARDVGAELREGLELDIADLCREHAELSIHTLVKTQKARKASWGAKVSAANSILDRVDGKPGTKEHEKAEGGLTIVVNQLYLDGKPTDIEIQTVAKEVEIVEDMAPTQEEIDLHGDGSSIVVRSPLR